MTTDPRSCMTPDVVLARVIRVAARVLPGLDDAWGRAIAAELHQIPTLEERLTYTASSLWGLVIIATVRRLDQWRQHAVALQTMCVVGLLIAVVDLRADSRWPLRIGILLASAAAGWMGPRVAAMSGALAALGLPLMVMLSGYRGPYAADRGDIWLPVIPAILAASVCGWLRSRLKSRQVPRRP